MKKGFAHIEIIVAILLIATVGVLVFWVSRNPSSSMLSQASPSPEAMMGEVDMSGWESYTNEKYGFKIKYPPGWYLYKEGSNGTGSESTTTLASFDVVNGSGTHPNAGSGEIKVTVHVLQESANIEFGEFLSEEEITVDGIETKKISTLGFGYGTTVNILKNNLNYLITTNISIDDPDSKHYISIFNQILSTFEFVENMGLRSYETVDLGNGLMEYTDDDLGIKFRFPKGYEFRPSSSYISLISPLNENRDERQTQFLDGELKVEFYIDNANGIALEEFVDEKKDDNLSTILEESNIKLGGIDTILWKWKGFGTGETRFLLHNLRKIGIAKYPLETSRNNEFQAFLDSIEFY